MSSRFSGSRHGAIAVGLLCAGMGGVLVAHAQGAPPTGVNAKRQAVEERQAEFKLIGANFRPLGGVLKGDVPYDEATVTKRLSRVVFLAGLLNEAFGDKTNIGEPETKAKPEIWANRADFDTVLKKFQDDLTTLAAVNEKEKGLTAPFKVALGAAAQDCKACHEKYRAK